MHDLTLGLDDMLSFLKPDTFIGAGIYLLIFVLAALLLARGLRAGVHAALTRQGHAHIDRTTVSFLQQIGTASIWVIMLILYAHLIPVLRAMGTALLAGASIASVVIGLAAQSTLGNLVAGVAITIYRPFRLGDTTLRTPDGRLVVLPNSIAASQVSINLSESRVAPPLPIVIQVSRETDAEAARQLALTTAREALDQAAVIGCFLTRIDATGTTLELRVRVPASTDRDALRSKLVAELAQRFAAGGLDSAGSRPASFS
jgi:small conductance mechanosensitive channel